ncbi:hypothetical protein Tco_0024081 [Tanacetum coccineum]
MLAPSSGGLILYQAYDNLYAMTGRKAHLLEDKQIPSVGVFDEDQDDMFETDKSARPKSNNIKSTVINSDSEEVENLFMKDNGKPMNGLFDDARKKVKAPPKKTHRKTCIWSGRKTDSPKRNVAISLEMKVHYFDREDIEKVEHENADRKKS